MTKKLPEPVQKAFSYIATLFGHMSGKINIQDLCARMGCKRDWLEERGKEKIILEVLKYTYFNDVEGLRNFLIKLLTIHGLSSDELVQVNAHLKNIGYVIRKGNLYELSYMEEAVSMINELVPQVGKDVKIMAEAYIVLHGLENTIRRSIRKVMVNSYGPEWWEQKVAERIRTNADTRKEKEIHSPWHDVEPTDMLSYTTFEELQNIIQSHWDKFKDLFYDQHGLVSRLKELEIPRNTIAHNRQLKESELERIRLFSTDIFRCIKHEEK